MSHLHSFRTGGHLPSSLHLSLHLSRHLLWCGGTLQNEVEIIGPDLGHSVDRGPRLRSESVLNAVELPGYIGHHRMQVFIPAFHRNGDSARAGKPRRVSRRCQMLKKAHAFFGVTRILEDEEVAAGGVLKPGVGKR